MKTNLKNHDIIDYVLLQEKIINIFLIEFHHSKDYELLLDFPRKGEITIDDETWRFLKHGKGFRFQSDTGHIVDIINNIKQPYLFDIWRLEQFFPETEKKEILRVLAAMLQDGLIHKTANDQYEYLKSS